MVVDRSRVKSSFQRGAFEYDHHTPVQQRIVDRLLSNLTITPDASVLDIGCGTGRLLAHIIERAPDCSPVGLDLALAMLHKTREQTCDRALLVQAEAEHLPFQGNSFDQIVSSSTFQWCDSIDLCFSEVYRCLKQGGRFSFALFGEGTLSELREAWQEAWDICGLCATGDHDGTHRFHSPDQVEESLIKAGFNDIKVELLLEQEWYPDVAHLLQSVKRIGAGSSRPAAGMGLGWRRVLHTMAAYYTNRYGNHQGVPASYRVIWGEGVR